MAAVALDGLAEFEAVARRLSFTEAATDLDVNPTVLTRRIQRLEARLGVRLLHRTTRRVSLTEAGAAYLADVEAILARAAEAEAAAAQLGIEPVGRLRAALPNLFGQRVIAPLLPAFLDRNPNLRLELTFADQMIDLVSERIDCAVRIGALQAGGDLVVRNLCPNRRILCTAPAYLARFGVPRSPEDLPRHRLLHFRPLLSGARWRLERGADRRQVAFEPVMAADNAEALRLAVVAGAGIALLATFVIAEDLRAGRIVAVLPDWTPAESIVSFVYPNAPHTPLKVRALANFLAEELKGPPHWDQALVGVD